MAYFDGRSKASTNKGGNGSFLKINGELQDIAKKKESLLRDAASCIASYGIEMNNSGAAKQKTIQDDLNTMLKGFTDAEKAELLTQAFAVLVVNA